MTDPSVPPRDELRRALGATLPSADLDPAGAREHLRRTVSTDFHARPAAADDSQPLLNAPRLGQRLASTGLAWSGAQSGPRFVVGDLLGAGATGRVFTVRDLDLDRELAVKVLAGAAAGDPERLAAFIDEARVTASLAHPNVLPVHEIDVTAQGQPFFTMTKIAGVTLAAALERSTPAARDARVASWNEVVSIHIAIGNALAYAHHRGLVHQDVKPDNVLLGDFGEVLLLDWGSAVRPGSGTSSLYGTPIYMSPEQARREGSTAASDVYCLGATLFHALSLRLPTWDDDSQRFWDKKSAGVVDAPTADERRRIPPELLAIALKAMAPRPADRYAAIEALVRDLQRWQAGQAVSAHRDSLWRFLVRWYAANRRVVWVAAAAAALVLASSAMLWREKAKERSDWHLVYQDDFAAGDAASVGREWIAKSRGWNGDFHEEAIGSPHFRLVGGRLVMKMEEGYANLVSRRRLLGDVRVEWDYTPLAGDQNLNCFIGADDRFGGYTCHVGGWNLPYYLALSRGPQAERMVEANRPGLLRKGRSLHYRLEREGARVSLTIDGDRVLDYLEYDDLAAPPGVGFGFDCCMGGENAIEHVRVYHRPLAQKTSPLAVGERLYQLGRYADAERAFAEVQESYPGTALEPEAMYKRARSAMAIPDAAAARPMLARFCERFPHHAAMPLALHARRRLAHEAGDAADEAAVDLALTAFNGHPVLTAVLRDVAAAEVDLLNQVPVVDFHGERVPTPALADATVAGHRRIAAWCSAHGMRPGANAFHTSELGNLLLLGRGDLVLELMSEDHAACAVALRDMGRWDEALKLLPDDRGLQFLHALDDGAPERALPLASLGWERSEAAVDLDRPELAQQSDPDDRPMQCMVLMRCGRAQEVLDRYADLRGWCALALIALGRHQEVLDHYQDVFANYFSAHFEALVGAGHLDEAWTLLAGSTVEKRKQEEAAEIAVAMLAAGERARAAAILAELAALPDTFDGSSPAFSRFIFPALVRRFAGEPVDLAQEWRAGALGHRSMHAQATWHDAAFLAGLIDQAAFRAQPNRRRLDSRLAFLLAVRADLDGRAAEAIAGYEAFASGRMLAAAGPFAHQFMLWRLRELRGVR